MAPTKGFKRTSASEKDSMVALYQSGSTTYELSSRFGITPTAVNGILERRGIERRHQKYIVNESFFDEIDTESKAYWLGFLYADGYLGDDNSLEIELSATDITHLEMFKKSLGSNHPIVSRIKSATDNYVDRNLCRLMIKRQILATALRKKGVTQAKSKRLEFPSEFIVPADLLPHFIRGNYDGDGCLYFSSTRTECSVSWMGTLSFLSSLASHFSTELSLVPIMPKLQRGTYYLRYGGKYQVRKICEYIYNDSHISLDRKREHYVSFIATRFASSLRLGAVSPIQSAHTV